jgi:hypothetical protein
MFWQASYSAATAFTARRDMHPGNQATVGFPSASGQLVRPRRITGELTIFLLSSSLHPLNGAAKVRHLLHIEPMTTEQQSARDPSAEQNMSPPWRPLFHWHFVVLLAVIVFFGAIR